MNILTIGAVNKEVKSKKAFVEITFIIFADFLMFYRIFFSPQGKRSAIASNKDGIYELPHDLPNDFRLQT